MTKLKISLSISYLHPEHCVLPTSYPYIYTTGREMERKIVFPQFKESLLCKKNPNLSSQNESITFIYQALLFPMKDLKKT